MGFVKTKEITTVDSTGNVSYQVTEKEYVHRSEEEPFFQVYVNYIGWMYGIHGGAPQAVLLYFMENADYNTGIVHFTSKSRKRLLSLTGLSRTGLYKALKHLEKMKAIAPIKDYDDDNAGGEYMINPQMFWKGEKDLRRNLIVTFKAAINDDVDIDGFTVVDTPPEE